MEGRNGELSRRAQRLRAGALATVLAMLCWAAPASAVVSTGDNPQTSGISPPTPSTAPSESGTERDDEDLTGDEGSWPVLTSTDHNGSAATPRGTAALRSRRTWSYTLTPADVDRGCKFRVRGTSTAGAAARPTRSPRGRRHLADRDTVLRRSAAPPRTARRCRRPRAHGPGRRRSALLHQWQRCTPACSNIAGATSATYGSSRRTPGNGTRQGHGAAHQNASGHRHGRLRLRGPSPRPHIQRHRPPDQRHCPPGRDLSAGNGTWNGTTPLTYSYVWKRCAACSRTVGTAPCTPRRGRRRQQARAHRDRDGRAARASESAMSATVAPRPPSGGGSGGGGTTGGATTGGGTTTLRKLSPFPVVAIGGRVFPRGVLVSQLRVSRAPRGAVVTVTCRGRGCPFRRMRRTVKRRSGCASALERSLARAP